MHDDLPHGHAPQPRNSLQHTLNHLDCPACDETKRQSMTPQGLAVLPFPQAALIWLDSRQNICSEPHSTRFMYKCYIKAVRKFLGEIPLNQIHIGHIQEYQRLRTMGAIDGLRAAGPDTVNHELNMLQQVMTRAGLWAAIADWYEPLQLRTPSRGVALSEEEERRIFRVASDNKRWLVAYCCSLIMANTTAGPGEIRKLRLQDVDIDRAVIFIREGAKNDARVRQLPLNDDALWATKELLSRAWEKGSIYPHHYLLPHRAHVRGADFDPNKPMGSWKKAWDALRKAVGMPTLRMYDLRHHAITKLLENPNVSEKTVEDLAGHISERMKDTYSHIRTNAKRAAVDALSGGYTTPKQKGPQAVPPWGRRVAQK